MKKILIIVNILLAACLSFGAYSVEAYDTHGYDYSPRCFMFALLPLGDDNSDAYIPLEGTDGNAESAESAETLGRIPSDTTELYGISVTGIRYSELGDDYTAYLKNQYKPHYLPQLDFVTVTMRGMLKYLEPNLYIPIYGYERPINTIYVPDEVLFFVSVGSKADEELFALSEKSGFIEYCGVKLKDVSVIARYEEGEGDCALALYSLKLCKAEDTRALVRLLNSHAFESSKNAALYADLGYSALQSYYLDAIDMPYELVTSEDTLIIGADSRYSHYADVKAVLSGSASELCGYAVESAEEICTAEGYTVCRIRLGAGVDAEAAIANMQAVGMAAEYAAYELQDVTAGDANGDGAIDNLDAATVLMIDAGLAEADGVLGDANGDGKVNNLDAALILQYDAGLISGF